MSCLWHECSCTLMPGPQGGLSSGKCRLLVGLKDASHFSATLDRMFF